MPDPGRAHAARRRRSLLSIARMMESEDPDSSQKAYEDLSQETGVSRESVEAILGLARLAARRNQKEQAATWARQAPQLARQVGPVPTASASLDAALLIGGSEGLRLAEDSFRIFGQLHNSVGQARAYLAAFWLRGSGESAQLRPSAELLSGVAASGELRPDLPWLLPLLARAQARTGDSEIERLISRLSRNNPQEAARQVEGSLLEVPARVELVKALSGAPGAEPLLQRLCSNPEEAVRQAAQVAMRSTGSTAGPPPVRIFALGILEVYRGEERVPDNVWKSQKVRYLLACLGSQSGRAVSEDILIEEFWPDDPSKGKQNVYAAVSSLRRSLKPSHWEGTDLDYVLRTPRGLQLNPELPRWHDLDEFSRLVTEAQHREAASQPVAAAETYAQAVRLYRGPYLEGCYMEWALTIRNRVERQVMEAYRSLLTLTAQQGHWVEVLEHGHRLLEIDPCCQEGYQYLMQANLALGRAEESVRLYELCTKLLRRELAMEPSIAIFEQYQRALINLSSPPVG
jgi:DNA-binding SARP family transcriptional activator